MILLFLIQAAAAAPDTLPDIALDVQLRARSVHVERKGEAKLSVRAEPDAGTNMQVQAPPSQDGAKLNNVHIRVQAEARVADPQQNSNGLETRQPQ